MAGGSDLQKYFDAARWCLFVGMLNWMVPSPTNRSHGCDCPCLQQKGLKLTDLVHTCRIYIYIWIYSCLKSCCHSTRNEELENSHHSETWFSTKKSNDKQALQTPRVILRPFLHPCIARYHRWLLFLLLLLPQSPWWSRYIMFILMLASSWTAPAYWADWRQQMPEGLTRKGKAKLPPSCKSFFFYRQFIVQQHRHTKKN